MSEFGLGSSITPGEKKKEGENWGHENVEGEGRSALATI
jgi:hypothetical protein